MQKICQFRPCTKIELIGVFLRSSLAFDCLSPLVLSIFSLISMHKSLCLFLKHCAEVPLDSAPDRSHFVTMAAKQCDVAIVGGGMVGLSLALALNGLA